MLETKHVVSLAGAVYGIEL